LIVSHLISRAAPVRSAPGSTSARTNSPRLASPPRRRRQPRRRLQRPLSAFPLIVLLLLQDALIKIPFMIPINVLSPAVLWPAQPPRAAAAARRSPLTSATRCRFARARELSIFATARGQPTTLLQWNLHCQPA